MKKKKVYVGSLVLGLLLVICYMLPASKVKAAMSTNSDSSISFQAGALSILSVPNFEFGTWEISPVNRTYSLQADASIAVADLRGSTSGWTLTVKQETQLKTQQNEELSGAQILMKTGTATPSTAITLPSQIQLIPGNAATVMTCSGNAGSNLIQATWQGKNVTLTVPGSTSKYATQYTCTLTWTLADVPTNE